MQLSFLASKGSEILYFSSIIYFQILKYINLLYFFLLDCTRGYAESKVGYGNHSCELQRQLLAKLNGTHPTGTVFAIAERTAVKNLPGKT